MSNFNFSLEVVRIWVKRQRRLFPLESPALRLGLPQILRQALRLLLLRRELPPERGERRGLVAGRSGGSSGRVAGPRR